MNDTMIEGSNDSIRLEGLKKTFGDMTAVDGIDLNVKPGELVVLLGPSGCGKTTTLRMIAGLETVSEGSIYIGDEEVTNTLPQRRDVSMVFQNYALYPHLTVRENLEFPLGKVDVSDEKRQQIVEDAAELLEISDLLERTPDQLSGGERQRVAVGRTIVREPKIFLMDEPLSNLDAKLRVQTRSEIRDLQQRLGTTTLYVTHDQEEALSIADRIVIMNDGQIEQMGPPEDVYLKPNTEFVAGFLGEPSMNFLDVENGDVFSGERAVSGEKLGLSLSENVRRIGIRPEDIYLDPNENGKRNVDAGALTPPLTFKLDVIEPLGHEYEVILRRGRTKLAIKTPTLARDEGEEVKAAFDLSRVMCFDESGERCR
ncbi:MAG: ABC transporter ATP-binding protein [Halobacteriaceae archaeon]